MRGLLSESGGSSSRQVNTGATNGESENEGALLRKRSQSQGEDARLQWCLSGAKEEREPGDQLDRWCSRVGSGTAYGISM